MPQVQRKLDASQTAVPPVKADKLRALSGLQTLLERARRIRIQQRHDKHKLYALHAACSASQRTRLATPMSWA